MNHHIELQAFETIWPKLQNDLVEIENQRLDLAARYKKFYIIFGVLALVAVLVGVAFLKYGPVGFIVSGIAMVLISIAVYFVLVLKHKRQFLAEFKTKALRPLIQSLYPGFDYDHKQGINQSEYQQSNLFTRRFDRYRSEDLVHGKLDKTDMYFSEVHSEYYTTDKDNKKTWHTIFYGIFMVLDANKHFQHRTYVLPDVAEGMFGGVGKWLQDKTTWMGSQGDLVYMENPDFEKAFKVMSKDQIEARYLITPDMMLRLLELRQRNKREIYIGFVDGKIYVGLSIPRNQPFLEPSIFRSLLEPQTLESFYYQLRTCLEVVQILDLNTRIWTKD